MAMCGDWMVSGEGGSPSQKQPSDGGGKNRQIFLVGDVVWIVRAVSQRDISVK